MSYQFNRITVLVVEDNQPMMDITKSLLVTFGVGHVVGAQDGDAGFERFVDYNPDLVIADWMMKPTNGIDFTRRVRTDSRSPNPYVPIILMTGFSEKRRVFEARDAGVTEFLVKPFTARDLYKRIAQIIERPRQFVKAPEFFGPDRRRKDPGKSGYMGPFRRDSDLADPRIRKIIEERRLREESAHQTLKEIREKAGLKKGDAFDLSPDDLKDRHGAG